MIFGNIRFESLKVVAGEPVVNLWLSCGVITVCDS